MRSTDIKIHRTSGTCNSDKDDRLIKVRAAIQLLPRLAAKVVMLHDHKGHLAVHHVERLTEDEATMIRATWQAHGEAAEDVRFYEHDFGPADVAEHIPCNGLPADFRQRALRNLNPENQK